MAPSWHLFYKEAQVVLYTDGDKRYKSCHLGAKLSFSTWRTLTVLSLTVATYRRPGDLLAAILRVPFVDLFTCMTRPELPLTVHEYGEWGNPTDPKVLQQV